jgi:hypothetical protein
LKLTGGGRPFGLLVVDGLLVRETVLSDTVSAELLGPRDVLRPWQADPAQLLRKETRYAALEATRICALDERLMVAFPEVMAVLAGRVIEQAHRVAIEKAIAQLNGVDRRLLALFWSLAERWGRVSPDGVVIPVSLPHRVVAQLVGARRPTVSTMLARLARDGRLVRRDDGTWLLTGDPVGQPVGDVTRRIRTRRYARRGAPLSLAAT